MQGQLTTGDVRVIGQVHGTHTIEDLNRDVPYDTIVTIPAEDAFRSVDLWRGITQRCLVRLPLIPATDPNPKAPVALPTGPDPEKLSLVARIRDLETQIRDLTAENLTLKDELRRGNQDQSQKLDTILAALKNGIPQAAPSVVIRNAVVTAREEVADGTAPTFLPSEIKPTNVTAHIDIQGESAPSELSDAAERLRKLRKGGA